MQVHPPALVSKKEKEKGGGGGSEGTPDLKKIGGKGVGFFFWGGGAI